MNIYYSNNNTNINTTINIEKSYIDTLVNIKKHKNREQLNKMLLFIREGDIIYTDSFRSLAFNMTDLRTICLKIIENGASIIFLDDTKHIINANNILLPTQQLWLNLLLPFGDMEQKFKSNEDIEFYNNIKIA